ncbi:MAG TPA: hypothetical protein PK808_03250, partial [Polymorphobacter sp.]|nr:hypothetical protein [Polymorphobacter sp.]
MNTLRFRRLERLTFWAWLVMVIALALLLVILATAATVRHAMTKGPKLSPGQSELVMMVADFPSGAKAAVMEIFGTVSGKSYALVVDRTEVETPAWQRKFPARADPGYILLSGVDPQGWQSSVRLIRIADGQLMARWMPDWSAVLALSTASPFV